MDAVWLCFLRKSCLWLLLALCSIQYWGRVTGTTGADYIVCVGITSTMEAPQKKYYYM